MDKLLMEYLGKNKKAGEEWKLSIAGQEFKQALYDHLAGLPSMVQEDVAGAGGIKELAKIHRNSLRQQILREFKDV